MANRVEFTELGHKHSAGQQGVGRRRSMYPRAVDSQPAMLEPFETAFVQRQVLTCTDYDNSVRWNVGERLHHVFERQCDRFADRAALMTDVGFLTYRELDERANQLARHLIEQGIMPGDRVALLFDKSTETYVTLLAVLKVNAAYVPLDAGFPVERLRFILADANIKTVVSMTAFADRLQSLDVRKVFVDRAARAISTQPRTRLTAAEVASTDDQLCYIIYTSGTTGNPKGVAIEHRSICNFVQVAAELYGYRPGDRVYQGMAICFDFSVEEIWVPLMAGATLVPGRPGGSLMGDELADFLREEEVTCLACCPTLLATIEQELPKLRVLLVGGEACPHPLVKRWYRPGRTILNSYGPTEATVTATLTELTPHKPVTIGKPLPTYSIVILDPVTDQVMPSGEAGEIGIAGIGLAAFYVNREELTQQKFISDFLGMPNNPSKRIYRTGDLGRITEAGEIEYLGRIDTQVKIRGYRIELTEIESVLLALPQIAQAAVTTYEPEPGTIELVAYYALKPGAAELSHGEIAQALRGKLPAYMVPAFIEQLPFIPMSISNKADHKRLPKPKGQRCPAGRNIVEARTENERVLAAALAEVMQVEQVSAEDHFFDDLGAHSLLMARVCAKLRQVPGMSHVSMRDIYQHPTVAKLAAHLGNGNDGEDEFAARREAIHVPSDFAYYGCGALQLMFYAGYALLGLSVFAAGFSWTYEAVDSTVDLYLRATAFAAAMFFGFSALPIAAKWLLIGEWKAESFPVWSLRYFRFWVVKTLMRTAPAAAFVGSPIYNIYLRLLGARIGRNAVILSRFVPVATDLFAVGHNTVLRKDTILLGYKAQSNFIHIGPIEIGSDAFVGEASVLDIDTAMGDRTQLGYASSLQTGQRVPEGRRYHGSPAIETDSNYCPIENRRDGSVRRGFYAASQLIGLLAILTPLPIVALTYWYPVIAPFVAGAETEIATTTAGFLGLMLLASAGLFFGSLLTGLLGIYVAPRVANLFLTPGRDYPLYGFHYWMQQIVFRMSNSQFYNVLFGDSSFIVSHMRLLGWKLNEVDQTGSNFGTNQRHDNPFLCDIGSGTMVSDGLSMINMQMSSSSFRLETARIGDRNYLGNDIHYPPGGRTGANCLLGTKVMIPVDGPVRENVGLLGSPCFEIPRIVDRDKDVNAAITGETRRVRLRGKNWHNLVTAGLFLVARFAFFFVAVVVSHLAVLNYEDYGVLALLAAGAVLTVGSVLFFALIERASLGFKRLGPTMVSIYDSYFWSHERHWKLSDSPITELFGGTPFKNTVSRLLGVEIGRKVFDGGCSITERTLTQIGDLANLNEGSVMQAHSLEEGVFKSDHIRMGTGCTLGAGAFAHYGVTMGDHVVLEADSFLMKGEMLDSNTVWCGNPATLIRSHAGQDAVGSRVAVGQAALLADPAEFLAAACVAAE
jgi:non-ribosomal peptide synthetase-like protein